MSPYEIAYPGGSVEHMNEEAGAVWLERVLHTYPATVWLNPVKQDYWSYSQSTTMIRQLFGEVPDNLDDYTFASQVSQAEAKKFFIENGKKLHDSL